MAGGTEPKTGAIVSLIVISWLTVMLLPHESIMDHVRVMVAGPFPFGGESVPITVPVPIQLSV